MSVPWRPPANGTPAPSQYAPGGTGMTERHRTPATRRAETGCDDGKGAFGDLGDGRAKSSAPRRCVGRRAVVDAVLMVLTFVLPPTGAGRYSEWTARFHLCC